MKDTFNLVIDNVFFNEFDIKNILQNDSNRVYNLEICNINDVSNRPDENFYYIINKITEFLNFNHDNTIMSKIPNNIKEVLKSHPNFKLIFLELNESDFEDTIDLVVSKLEEEGINSKQVYYVGANQKLNELKQKSNSDINVYTINHGQFFNCQRLIRTNPEYTTDKDFLFMTHNRNLKSHRVGLLCLLKKYDLLDKIDWSLLMGSNLKRMFGVNDQLVEWFFPKIFSDEDTLNLHKELKYLSDLGDKKSCYETHINFTGDGYKYDYDDAYKSKCYLKSYINITTETNYESPYIVHITEKTFNPFNFYQIPIFVATYQHVKFLRELYDFDMFDDLVNHSYDNEINNDKRLFMIADEIKRLSEKEEEIKEFYINNKARFNKNRNIINEILKDNKDYNFFQSLV